MHLNICNIPKSRLHFQDKKIVVGYGLKQKHQSFYVVTVSNVKEINGQTFDDITPEDSTETGEDDYEEDDEYDDEDSNGIGFGLEYMPALQGTVKSPCTSL